MPAKVRSFCKRHRAFLLSCALFALLCVLLTRAGQRPDRYAVQAEWDAQARTLRVEQTVLLTNRTGAALSVLDFHLYANAFSQEESAPVLPQERKYAYPEGFSPGGAEVAAVQVNGRDAPWELSGEGDTVLRVFLPFRLRPQGGVEVRLSYSVALSDNRLRTGVSARDVRLCNAFATLCAHDGESFRHDAYGAIGDPFVSACASWEVHLRAPTSLVAAGPGLVSASEGSWTFSGENLRDFALVLSPDFCVAQGEVDGVTVRSFAFDQEGAQQALDCAMHALSVFSGLFGGYPFPDFTVCAAEFFPGGMEYPALALVNAGLYETENGMLEFAIAHEAAHQWWYAGVGSDQVLYPWQDEALAEYSTLLYYESLYGAQSFDSLYAARIRPATESLALQGVGVSQSLDRFESGAVYDALVYRKGAAMLHDLRARLGNEAFVGALRKYYAENLFTVAAPGDLLAAFGPEGADRALRWLRGDLP